MAGAGFYTRKGAVKTGAAVWINGITELPVVQQVAIGADNNRRYLGRNTVDDMGYQRSPFPVNQPLVTATQSSSLSARQNDGINC